MGTTTASNQELFATPQADALSAWATLDREMSAVKNTPLSVWKGQYQRWKLLYQKFRLMEEKALYVPDEKGRPQKLSDGLCVYHKKIISALLFSGQDCVETLMKLPIDQEEQAERSHCRIQIETLLAALRETMEIWHPANKESLAGLKAAVLSEATPS